jgi:chorismate mutase
MPKTPRYFVVEAQALPEIFVKVAEAKRLFDTGEVDTVHKAARMVGISRSAFYKYKDAVRPFNDMLHGRIVTLQIILKDQPGVLSSVLGVFAGWGANVLTINQTIPTNGCAAVTVTAETNSLSLPLEEVEDALRQTVGVVKCEILAG